MKRNFTVLLLSLLAASTVSAQRLLTEDFNYNTGNLVSVSDTVWENFSGDTKFIQVIPGNLSYAGYNTSPVDSAKIMLDSAAGNAEDVLSRFSREDTGTVYSTFLLNVLSNGNLFTNNSGKGEYFASFLPAGTNTVGLSAVVIRRGVASGTFNLGLLSRTDSTVSIVWANTDYTTNTTLLVAIGYHIIAGDSNNVASLWINPPTDGTQPAPNAEAIDIETGSIRVSKVALYQRSSRSPQCEIDAIKVSTTWTDAVLPLRLLAFNVINNNGYASLSWQTCNEINVNEFEVQRSTDAQNFVAVGHVQAKNLSCGATYTYSDPKELAGKSYYRIRMVDKDGKSSYSGIVSVDGKLPTKISVFPNPVTDNVSISHPKAENNAIIKIVSLNGAVIATYPVMKDAVQTNINVSKMAKGNYIVVFQNAQQKQTIKIVKQ